MVPFQPDRYYRSLIEHAHDIIAVMSEEGVFHYCSPSVTMHLGYQPAELAGRSGLEFTHPDDRDLLRQRFMEVACQVVVSTLTDASTPGQALRGTYRLLRRDGTWGYFECTAKNLLHVEAVRGIVVVFNNITDRVVVEKELVKKEKYFRTLIENTFEVVLVRDADGRITYVSPSVENILGYRPEELLGEWGFSIFLEEDVYAVIELGRSLFTKPGESAPHEIRLRRKDGRVIHTESVVRNLLDDEAVRGMVINFRDITAQKESESRLRLSERYYRSLIENSNDLISICDQNVNFFYASPSVERTLGYSPEEYLRLNGHGLTHPDYAEATQQTFLRVLEQPGVPITTEFLYRRKNGTWVFLESIFYNLLDDEAVRGVVMVSRDAEERKRTEELLKNYNEQLEREVNRQTHELQRKNEKLHQLLHDLRSTQSQLLESEKMASLGQLTAGIAHEINNPINFISSNISPLRRDIESLKKVVRAYESVEGPASGPDRNGYVQRVKQEVEYEYVMDEIDWLLNGMREGADRTAEIVKGLRSFSRVDESQLRLTDVNEGIESTLTLLQNKLKEGISVHKHYGALPLLEGHPSQLNQVFMNVLVNAIQAIRPGTGRIDVTTAYEGNHVTIAVRDSGRGMPEAVRRRAFEPFFTTKPVGEGTGLGLSISYGIVEKHAGSIGIRSEPGQGSELLITLPVVQPDR
ncbi:MAG: PAS domain S-box protein [Ferruginibacter sp.]|nr:PAS domain S-box protein [Cytophagales bacterium]